MISFGYDPSTGLETVAWVEGRKIRIQQRQWIPDNFVDQVKFVRDHGNQDIIGYMPHVMKEKLLREGNTGQAYDLRDPDRDKAMKRIWNDIDYRKLRVNEGRV